MRHISKIISGAAGLAIALLFPYDVCAMILKFVIGTIIMLLLVLAAMRWKKWVA